MEKPKPTPPARTPEQLKESLEKAAEARTKRKEIKKQLSLIQVTLEEVIQLGKQDPAIGKLTVVDLLKCLPGIGIGTAKEIIEKCSISLKRKIRGLGWKQLERLLDELADRGYRYALSTR